MEGSAQFNALSPKLCIVRNLLSFQLRLLCYTRALVTLLILCPLLLLLGAEKNTKRSGLLYSFLGFGSEIERQHPVGEEPQVQTPLHFFLTAAGGIVHFLI